MDIFSQVYLMKQVKLMLSMK